LALSVLILAFACGALVAAPAAARPAPQATWTAIASPPKTVTQTRAVFLKNKVYVIGGWLNDFFHMYDGVQVYSTGGNSWTTDNSPIPSGALAQAAVCTDGSKVYVVGGITLAGQLLSTMQIYDPSKKKGARWSTGPNMHMALTGDLYLRDEGCAWIGGKLYVFGGDAQSDTGQVSGIVDLTWVYAPGTGQWSDTGFRTIQANWTFGFTSDGSNAYVAGGQNANGDYYRGVSTFTPAGGWSPLAKLPVPGGAPAGTGLYWPGLAVFGSKLAVFGGSAQGGPNAPQVRTLTCPLPCSAGASWTNAHKNLATGRYDFAWASGGSTPTLYAIGGSGASGFLATAEKTT
jgi:hypothetical protein